MDRDELVAIVTSFQNTTIGLATGNSKAYEDWEEVRAQIVSVPELTPHLPRWVVETRFSSQCWGLMKDIKTDEGSYAARRAWIYSQLQSLFDVAEQGGTLPLSDTVGSLVENCSSDAVASAWQRIHERRVFDPEACITASRSLVESVCKFILNGLGEPVPNDLRLPQLYKLVAKELDLSVDGEHEYVIKQLLGGCAGVVSGIAGLRNQLGDAHGKSPNAATPDEKHADLAANLAGSLSAFLIATYEERST